MFVKGFLIRFASRPVLTGFTMASAVLTIASVTKDLLGVPVARSQEIYTYMIEIANVLPRPACPRWQQAQSLFRYWWQFLGFD